jgi:hypothetical protein
MADADDTLAMLKSKAAMKSVASSGIGFYGLEFL